MRKRAAREAARRREAAGVLRITEATCRFLCRRAARQRRRSGRGQGGLRPLFVAAGELAEVASGVAAADPSWGLPQRRALAAPATPRSAWVRPADRRSRRGSGAPRGDVSGLPCAAVSGAARSYRFRRSARRSADIIDSSERPRMVLGTRIRGLGRYQGASTHPQPYVRRSGGADDRRGRAALRPRQPGPCPRCLRGSSGCRRTRPARCPPG